MAKLREAALAAAHDLAAAEPLFGRIGRAHEAAIIEGHMRSLLEQASDVARLWATVRGDHDARWATEELLRELRRAMEGA